MKLPKEVKVGIIATITIAVFIWLFNYMKGLNLLKSKSNYYVIYDKINGLNESNSVYINGYKIGLVDQIDFTSDHSGRLIVKLSTDKPFNIPKDSRAQIYSADLMGTQAVRILLGKSRQYFSSGDTISGEVEGGLQEQVSAQILPVKVKAENLLASFDTALAVIHATFNKDFRNNFNKSFQDIRSSVQHLNRTSITVDTFITNKNGQFISIVSNVQKTSVLLKNDLVKLDYVLDNLSEISDSLSRADMKAVIDNLNRTLSGTSILVDRINRGEGSLGLLTTNDSLYHEIRQLTHRLDTLVYKISEHPKKYIRVKIF